MQLDEVDAGVTCLKWSRCGNYLWFGGRQHSDIVCWDVRQWRCEVGRWVGLYHIICPIHRFDCVAVTVNDIYGSTATGCFAL